MTRVDVEARLAELASEAATCTACRLSEGRTQAVFADGSPDADIMFIGEGPGFYEDREGLPFVGKAGMLLNRLLGEVGLNRRDVYIANVVKCRPPGNRDPRPDEIEACKHFLVEQIRMVDPAVVMTMGNFATKLLLKTSTGITRTRGTVFPWWGRVVIPTFHPAAALRSGPAMADTIRGDLELAVRTADDRLAGPEPEGERSGLTDPEAEPPKQLGLFG
ncbi:MAG: uracil-DNA glycosylase [bacterium]|nr:uracil-DNA glycosylase [bacterium]MDE0289453.1 uracil-DNA glycosylase [bacterium]MDE0437068.1 uracil-DNA glycosylase [bacterium]